MLASLAQPTRHPPTPPHPKGTLLPSQQHRVAPHTPHHRPHSLQATPLLPQQAQQHSLRPTHPRLLCSEPLRVTGKVSHPMYRACMACSTSVMRLVSSWLSLPEEAVRGADAGHLLCAAAWSFSLEGLSRRQVCVLSPHATCGCVPPLTCLG